MDAATIARPWEERFSLRVRPWPALELATVVGLIEMELWLLRASAPIWLNVIVYATIVGVIGHSHRRRRLAGTTTPGSSQGVGRAWTESLVLCLAFSTMLMAAAWLVGDSNETFEFVFLDKPPLKLLNWLIGKFGAALGQQIALQMFLWPTCLELMRRRTAGAVLAASLFGLIHLPSPTLVGITTLAGFSWIIVYQRSGRIAPLVLSHMLLATLAHGGLPERLTYDMRVGSSATAGMQRFEDLKDPRIRLINRRLKENRSLQKQFSSQAYFEAQGGELTGLVRGLYRDLLGRTATEADLAYWTTKKLANPRDDLPTFLLASDEFAAIRERRRISGEPAPGPR